MKTIPASKLRAQFSELVKGLETGPITITKHGKAIAILTSPTEASAGLPQPSATTGPSEAFEATTAAREPSDFLSALDCEFSESDDAEFESYLRGILPERDSMPW
jgi:prevent-host-death family protein